MLCVWFVKPQILKKKKTRSRPPRPPNMGVGASGGLLPESRGGAGDESNLRHREGGGGTLRGTGRMEWDAACTDHRTSLGEIFGGPAGMTVGDLRMAAIPSSCPGVAPRSEGPGACPSSPGGSRMMDPFRAKTLSVCYTQNMEPMHNAL